jgi:hypothetical protein
VHILHHQHQGLRLRRVHAQVPQERQGPDLPRLWTEPCQAFRRHGEVQQVEQQGHVLLGGDTTRVELALVQFPRGQDCPSGMILLGHGRAKHHREALPGRQGEGAVVRLEDGLRPSHHRLEQAIPCLRAQSGDQGQGVRHGRAEHGHQLVFRLQDEPRGGRQGRRGRGRRRE